MDEPGQPQQDEPSSPDGSSVGLTLEFLWSSIRHLEDRITTVDTKANFLMGLVIAAIAVTGQVAGAAIAASDSVVRLAPLAALVTVVVYSAVILRGCLSVLNPRRASPEVTEGFPLPQRYVLWPRKSQQRTAVEHEEAVSRMAPDEQVANLAAMQTTLFFLVGAKYEHYRRAIARTRTLVVVETTIITALAIGLALDIT